MYPLHYKGVKLMDLKKTFGIKDATKKHTPGTNICNDPGMEYLSFTNTHQRSMTQLVQECSHHICEIVCLDNSDALLNDVAEFLSEFTILKQQTDMAHSMVQIYS